ncbi:MAG: flagellar biosynthetic protein FliR [Candidatus Dactylopiibacterium carminicum]|uniref:Flagellar biosynthetic protein FliR n=1 Tax=Candidatus Dactylopiibacterium carminicum TaxID=857335 RepID=A0A272ETL1_9RHOO|nr:flagellar biosynthetic protein FliR [Candidatus Dactylopiibacterium carminicum]KAF7599399.1 flagellar biosynthetic protein FliR [Candidatus Dactylopiibacterium carminicum]PAS93443.1 MAG: flagellar biosynthetic protein FliR [Candidatus Dactylopiibacterium carminicum]PAS95962.1 MAG: flagellar biosynthetic protein FliR [Candidatus Dactylopiibacterium carminicum]PAS99408.1 MAG: flagellar biosynthetic protein FliR [Candidatus Dactylopiibacterium carminicum]
MLQITSTQLDAFITAWLFPMMRVLGLIGSAPIFNNRAIPRNIRIGMGVIIGVAVAASLPPPPAIPAGSWQALLIMGQQVLIGLSMGLAIRVVMAAVDTAGEMIGLQMGLSFAVFFDPNNSGQTAVLSEILTLIASLFFLALNGHLMLIEVVVRSFEFIPIGASPMHADAWLVLVRMVSVAFASGVMIALPVVAALLITNIALAVLTRSAPQLNIFAVGFPITSTVGFIVLILLLQNLAPVLESLVEQGFEHVGIFLHQLGRP